MTDESQRTDYSSINNLLTPVSAENKFIKFTKNNPYLGHRDTQLVISQNEPENLQDIKVPVYNGSTFHEMPYELYRRANQLEELQRFMLLCTALDFLTGWMYLLIGFMPSAISSVFSGIGLYGTLRYKAKAIFAYTVFVYLSFILRIIYIGYVTQKFPQQLALTTYTLYTLLALCQLGIARVSKTFYSSLRDV